MITFTEIFILFVMVCIILMYIKNYYGEVEYVVSSIDKRRYLVRKLPDRKAAADCLARLNRTLTELVRHMVAKYPDNADVLRLHENYNPEALSEGGTEIGYTSYSVNKGEKIVMCIRQPSDNAFVDDNILVYVAVHELGHLMTSDVGHTDKFWSNFKWLLREAVKLGLYEKMDFANSPEPYCGIKISSSVI